MAACLSLTGIKIITAVARLAILFSLPVRGRVLQSHHYLSRSQKQNVTLTAREKLDPLIGLSLIEFEAER